MQRHKSVEVNNPGMVEVRKPAERNLLRDAVTENKNPTDPLRDSIVHSLVDRVVGKAQSQVPLSDGGVNERVQKERSRIKKAGEIWKNKMTKGKGPGSALEEMRSYYEESYVKRLLHPMTQRTYFPMQNETRKAKLEAIDQLWNAFLNHENGAGPFLVYYDRCKSAIKPNDLMDYIYEKDNKNIRLHIESNLENVSHLLSSLDSLIQRLNDSAAPSDEQKDQHAMLKQTRIECMRDANFWKEVQKLQNFMEDAYSLLDNSEMYIESLQKESIVSINAKKPSNDSVLENLREYRHHILIIMEKIDYTVNRADKNTNDMEKQTFIDTYSAVVKTALSEHLETLFKEIVPRHEAKRLARTDRKSPTPIWSLFFDQEMWHFDPQWQKDNPQYRNIGNPSHLPNPCGAVCVTRIFSEFHPEITESSAKIHTKFEEIYYAHSHPELMRTTGRSPQDDANYLNTELEQGRLRILIPNGKRVRFEVRQNFSYAQLKNTFMNVKYLPEDGNEKGPRYIPIEITVHVPLTHTQGMSTGAHGIVLHKQGDFYDEQGNHSLDFVVYDPYKVIKPTNTYALESIFEIAHKQTKSYGGKWVDEPGYMGACEAVVPVVYDIPEAKQ